MSPMQTMNFFHTHTPHTRSVSVLRRHAAYRHLTTELARSSETGCVVAQTCVV